MPVRITYWLMSLQLISYFRNDWEMTRQATLNFCRHLVATCDDAALAQTTEQMVFCAGQIGNAEAIVTLFESALKISERWSPASDKFKKYYQENIKTSFRKAVDEVERAVVMRIWELSKMKASGTGASDSHQGLIVLKQFM